MIIAAKATVAVFQRLRFLLLPVYCRHRILGAMSTMLQARTNWITSAEAAEIIGCTIAHVSLLIRHGEIEATKFGFAWAIEKSSAERFAKTPQKTGRPRIRESA